MAAAAFPEMKTAGASKVEQWGTFELSLKGPASGNPFVDVQLSARFRIGHRTMEVPGFYDGDGVYRVRYMPDMTGEWSCETVSGTPELHGHTASFTCTPPQQGNHGPVQVTRLYHFEHADGTPFFPFGTTCYAWAFLGDPYESQTLDTLKSAPFNKVRMCLLPKPVGHDLFAYPFERTPDGKNDLTRLNPVYFQHIEQRIQDLMKLGIQADVILFHPYDAWGYKAMPPDADDRYLRYAVARLSAYRNVWWSIANEYDLVKTKTTADWDRFFRIVEESDPSSHLRSIHHSRVIYDNAKPWVTHASLQSYAFENATQWREAWNKPIIFDEMQYEGNIARRWGNLSPEEMTRRFWMAIISGTYPTHGETYISTDGAPVWSDGGTLHGTSAARIGFLKKLLEESTTTGVNEYEGSYYLSAGTPNELYLWYFDYHQPAEYEFPLPEKVSFEAEWIDPWGMTTHAIPGTFSGKSKLQLPGKPYMAIRFKKTS
jgi:hypothetical protein